MPRDHFQTRLHNWNQGNKRMVAIVPTYTEDNQICEESFNSGIYLLLSYDDILISALL